MSKYFENIKRGRHCLYDYFILYVCFVPLRIIVLSKVVCIPNLYIIWNLTLLSRVRYYYFTGKVEFYLDLMYRFHVYKVTVTLKNNLLMYN